MQLYISMEGEPKEIADLVLFAQDRLAMNSVLDIDRALGSAVSFPAERSRMGEKKCEE